MKRAAVTATRFQVIRAAHQRSNVAICVELNPRETMHYLMEVDLAT